MSRFEEIKKKAHSECEPEKCSACGDLLWLISDYERINSEADEYQQSEKEMFRRAVEAEEKLKSINPTQENL